MPLSEHEQQILEEIEKRLAEEDPRLVEAVSRTSLYTHLARRIRWSSLAFLAGFVMLMLFPISLWIAAAGFGVMLVSSLLIYRYLKQVVPRDGERHRRAGPDARALRAPSAVTS